MTANEQNIFAEIHAERQYQADKWADGDLAKLAELDLERNGILDWVLYIGKHTTLWFTGGFARDLKPAFRTSMVKVAALAVSAIAWCDNKGD